LLRFIGGIFGEGKLTEHAARIYGLKKGEETLMVTKSRVQETGGYQQRLPCFVEYGLAERISLKAGVSWSTCIELRVLICVNLVPVL